MSATKSVNSVTITIEVKWNMMKVHQGKLKLSRKMWYAPGLDVYVVGTLKGGLYGQAANIAMNYAEGINIPARSVRSVNRAYRGHQNSSNLISDEGFSLKKRLL